MTRPQTLFELVTGGAGYVYTGQWLQIGSGPFAPAIYSHRWMQDGDRAILRWFWKMVGKTYSYPARVVGIRSGNEIIVEAA